MNAAAPDAAALLAWYDAHARDLPWRAKGEARPDPYGVWLSEIMLQQTTVAAVERYFTAFIRRWPTVEALAAADRDEVLAAWAGLGYYARARNLHACAQVVAGEMGGRFPRTARELRKLPGIGPYTAGAIAAIAFGEPVAAVDANAERVLARVFAITEPPPASGRLIREAAQALTPRRRAGDFAQALMDLGATLCAPKRPACGRCPWKEACAGRARGLAEQLPRKRPRQPRPRRRGDVYFIPREDGAVLLRRRPERGLLGGMAELPSGGWDNAPPPWEGKTPFGLAFLPAGAEVRHVFTHFSLTLSVWRLAAPLPRGFSAGAGFFWHPLARMEEAGLPGVMQKALKAALGP